ncbi:unnamed protein product [Rotaria socialis]
MVFGFIFKRRISSIEEKVVKPFQQYSKGHSLKVQRNLFGALLSHAVYVQLFCLMVDNRASPTHLFLAEIEPEIERFLIILLVQLLSLEHDTLDPLYTTIIINLPTPSSTFLFILCLSCCF